MVNVPASLGINTDWSHNTIDEIIIQIDCIFVRDAKLSLPIGKPENQLILLAISKVMLIIMDDLYFMEDSTVCLNKELLTVLIHIDLLHHSLTLKPRLPILEESNQRW